MPCEAADRLATFQPSIYQPFNPISMRNFSLLPPMGLAFLLIISLFSSCQEDPEVLQNPTLSDAGLGITQSASVTNFTVNVPSQILQGQSVTFSGACAGVHKLIASVDGWVIQEQVVEGNDTYSFSYAFSEAGTGRLLHINAFDRDGNVLTHASERINVYAGESVALQQMVMRRCKGLAPFNRPYSFDGVGDCWGYVRQVWNAILHDGQEHPEDYTAPYNKNRWILGGSQYIPVADSPSSNWAKVTSLDNLPIGVPLSTHKGHQWGAHWHGGIYAGKYNGVHYMWDCSGRSSMNGAYYRPVISKLANGYYYAPLYNRLKGL